MRQGASQDFEDRLADSVVAVEEPLLVALAFLTREGRARQLSEWPGRVARFQRSTCRELGVSHRRVRKMGQSWSSLGARALRLVVAGAGGATASLVTRDPQ
jgi:hypothetical protein